MTLEAETETQDAPAPVRPINAVDIAVGSNHCITNHRFDVCVQLPIGRTRRLRVSRYYWELEPPVAVDFMRDLQYGELELAAKQLYFKGKNILYAYVKDLFDGERVEEQLAEQRAVDQQQTVPEGRKPLMGPRQGRRSDAAE